MNVRFRSTVGALSCGVLALSLAACASDAEEDVTTDQDEAAVEEPDDGAEDVEEDPEGAEDEDLNGDDEDHDADEAETASADEAEVEIGATLEDPEMGDSVEILSAVRHFASEEQVELIEAGGEVVLLEVTVEPGDEFGGRISNGNFKISWDEGADFWNNDTRMIEEEMEAADRPPLEDISRSDGGEHHGWIAFFVDEQAETYLIEYSRSAAEVIGSDETIDEFVEEVEVPAP